MATLNNFGDSLSIQPSDTPGINIINEQLTGVENYGVWSRAMLIALRAKNKLAFIDGTCQRPAAGSLTFNQWERCNALVLSWIMNTVSKEIFGGIVYSTDASAVWNDLKEQFDKVNGSRIFAIHREIGGLRQGNLSISTYYCKLKKLWDEYASFVVLPFCTCDTARKYIDHDHQQKLLQFLLGLNDSYVHIRSQILMMDPLPSVGQAFSVVSQEESTRSLLAVEPPPSVFYSSRNKVDERKTDVVTCEYCHVPGHSKGNCYKLVGYPPGHRLYKPQQFRGPKKLSKDNFKPRQPYRDVNLATEVQAETFNPEVINNTPIFTPAQYAEIMKLLGGSAGQSPTEPMANMAGPQPWEDHGDW
ncbi:uncharacterized protein [Primulina eburnea]|uniref:uncharacterized protein n=1 Tax=Primulina eburnea TaxID=1245227 RepID=UPI003C6CB4DC